MNYKALAREKLNGKWMSSIGVALIYGLLNYFSTLISESEKTHFLIGIAINILIMLVAVGLTIYFLKLVRGEENITDLFIAFKDFKEAINYILLSLVTGLIITLGLLLFIIPGLIWSYSYKYAIYIKYDNPEMGISEVLKTSKELMDGRKMDAFLLDLSFIGWYFLGILALFIGVIPVSVYHQVAMTEFYENARETYFGVKNKDVDYVYMEDTAEVQNEEEVDYEGELTEEDIVSERDTDSNLY